MTVTETFGRVSRSIPAGTRSAFATAPDKQHGKPRLLVLSHVMPFPRSAGQEQRVFFTLKAARERFHVTFGGVAPHEGEAEARRELAPLCDATLLLPNEYQRSRGSRVVRMGLGAAYVAATGLRPSNYVIGRVQFSPKRVASFLDGARFDCVLFEYWHAAESAAVFQRAGVPCVLDMHDILWRSYERRLIESRLPAAYRRWALDRYRRREEQAWTKFDAVVAINREEERYVRGTLSGEKTIFHAPMGTDLKLWPYAWSPSRPARLAYYGSFASAHNQAAALRCAQQIMPRVWATRPETELWLVGSRPPERLRRLSVDPRIKVTGFLDRPQDVLQTMNAVLCPWVGTYGFRSRLVEVMALGVPTVVTPDAVWGMDLEVGRGLLIGESDEALAAHALSLLDDQRVAAAQSRAAREQVEAGFSLSNTYDRLIDEMHRWLGARRGHA